MEIRHTQFEKDLKVESVSGTSMIEVKYANKDPQMAVRAVRLLVERFKEKHLQVFSSNSTEFLEEKFGEYQQKLEESENDFAQFKQKNRIISLDEQKIQFISPTNSSRIISRCSPGPDKRSRV